MATQTELFRFTEQNSSEVWTYASGDELVSYDSGTGLEEYPPSRITRSNIESKSDMARANIDIQVPLTEIIGIRWLRDNGELMVGLTIFQRDRDGDISVIWKGRLIAIVPGMAEITLKFESIFTSMRRPGLRAKFQRSCRHALYGRGCLLDPEDFAVTGALSAISGTVVTVAAAAAQPDGYYLGGMLRSPDGVLSYITGHTGSQLRLQRLSYSLMQAIEAGMPFDVAIYPGCDHSYPTCASKFANDLRYGGFDFIPQKNPMGGSSIV